MEIKKHFSVLLLGLVLLFLFLPFQSSVAQDSTSAQDLVPELKIKIGGFGSQSDFSQGLKESGDTLQISWIGQYVSAIYQYGVGLAAVLAVVMIMAGGFIWLTAAGNPSQVGKAKEFISSALLGLFLAMFSYVILNALNPRLVNLEPLEVPIIKNVTPAIGSRTIEILGQGPWELGAQCCCLNKSPGDLIGTGQTVNCGEFNSGSVCSGTNQSRHLGQCQDDTSPQECKGYHQVCGGTVNPCCPAYQCKYGGLGFIGQWCE